MIDIIIETETLSQRKNDEQPLDYVVESLNYIVFFNRFKFKISKDTLTKIIKITGKYYQYKFKLKNIFR